MNKTKTCDCSEGSGKNKKHCTAHYDCYQIRGRVDYGNGTMSSATELITFYDMENNLGGEVSA